MAECARLFEHNLGSDNSNTISSKHILNRQRQKMIPRLQRLLKQRQKFVERISGAADNPGVQYYCKSFAKAKSRVELVSPLEKELAV
jgi:hypothetical protein